MVAQAMIRHSIKARHRLIFPQPRNARYDGLSTNSIVLTNRWGEWREAEGLSLGS